MILDYLANQLNLPRYAATVSLLDQAITNAFAEISVRPTESGSNVGTKSVANAIAGTCQRM